MKKQSGFTLIELAIVLVIIGLLLGGVLKGQELINSAKTKQLANDFNSVAAAVYGYQDRYKALPGDDSGSAARWAGTPYPAADIGNANGFLDNAGAACLFTDPKGSPVTDECYIFWTGLRQAGLVTGALTDGPPGNNFGGVLGVQNALDALTTAGAAGTGFKGIIACESNVPDKAAIALDTQLDDGKPDSGSIRAIFQGTPTTAVTVLNGVAASTPYLETGGNYYTVCKALQ